MHVEYRIAVVTTRNSSRLYVLEAGEPPRLTRADYARRWDKFTATVLCKEFNRANQEKGLDLRYEVERVK